MPVEFWLVRHGQAALGTDDYDRLTDLGWQQARWLGAHLAARGLGFNRVAAGGLRRQQETAKVLAESLGQAVETVPGLEEYDADALMTLHGTPPDRSLSRRDHFRRLRGAMFAWADGGLPGAPESWDDFHNRIRGALDRLAGKDVQGRVLAASSGGVIAATVSQVLGLGPERMIEMNLQARNTGITRLIFTGRTVYLNMFNAVPHLEHPDRAHAETYS